MREEDKKFLLTIKRNNNDYLPLEWHLTSFYQGEDLTTLKGIDKFTTKITRAELINEILEENMVDGNEKYRYFAIIYYEKGKNREVKEGTIFKEDQHILSVDEFIILILENLNNKQILSQIYNMCNINITNNKLEQFKYILKNIDLFKIKGPKMTFAALATFKELSYEMKRSILIRTSNKLTKLEDFSQKKKQRPLFCSMICQFQRPHVHV